MKPKNNQLLAFGFALALALLGAVAWHGWRHMTRQQETAEWMAHSHKVKAGRNHLLSLVLDIEIAWRSYVLSGQPVFLETFERAVDQAMQQQRTLKELIHDETQQANLTVLTVFIARGVDFARRTVDLRMNSGLEAASQEIATLGDKNLTDPIRAQIARMDARGEMLLAARSAAAQREVAVSRWLRATGGALSITLFVAVFALLLRENTLRHRGNLAVSESEEKLAVTLHSIGDAVLATDAAGRITRLNAVAEALTGWPQAEAVGRPAAEVFHIINEETRQPASIPLGDTLAKGTIYGLANHTLLLARDGRERPIVDSCAPIRNREGQVIGAVLVFRDVTEQREHEAALRRAHEELEQRVRERTAELELERAKLATAFGNTPMGLVLSNAQGGDIVMNAAAERMHGFASRADMPARVGDYANDWEQRDATGRVLPFAEWPLPRAIAGDYCVDRDLHLHNLKSGYQRDCSYTAVPVRNRAGEVSLIVITLVDITERKRTAAALREAKERLETASVAARVALWDWDIPSGALEWSRVVDFMLGYEAGGFPRSLQAWEDLIHPEDRSTVMQALTRHLEHGTPYDIEYRVRKCDGTYAWWHDVGSCRRAADDQACRMSGACIDITERKQAETEICSLNASLEQRVTERTAQLERVASELSHANAELAQISRLKDDFLANMSHELRTPLNSILGLSETLLEQCSGPLTERQIKSLTTISKSGQHLLALINDILDLSKIEAGKLELHLERLQVEEFCQSCLAFVRSQAMEKSIGVTFEHNGGVAHFPADGKRLKQILVNLLTNAVKFTPPGGRIGLTMAAPADEDVVRFTVSDTGIGIAAADQGKLFRSFTQIDSSLTRAQEGTGLGLALVAKLVELHGGSVALESEPGKGSRFIVTLPRNAASQPPPEATAKSEPDRRGYRRALIIEDDPTSGALLVNFLTELGLESVVHVQGEKSVEAALRERPDVILLDILLPNDSGWVVLTRLKEHPVTMDIPVVVISVVDEPKKSLALGAAAHFIKPVTREQLAEFFQRPAHPIIRRASRSPFKDPASGPVILLAEDNEANIETIGGYLADKGHTLHYATNGLVAVKLARELRPALILMDIQMPVMDGLSAIRELRADAAMKHIPIVALTALAMPGDRERCLAAGAIDYMSKPVQLKALWAVVNRLLAPPVAVGTGT